MFEKAVARGRYVEIGLKFLVDVDEAGRHADAGPGRKAQSMRLAGAVIRILPQDHDADALDRRQVERAEPLGPAREDAAARRLLGDEELLERRHIGLLEFARSEEHTSELQSLMR